MKKAIGIIGIAVLLPFGLLTLAGSGVASASVGTMRMIGQAISIGVATLVLTVIVGQHNIVPADYPHVLTSVRITFGVMAAMCVVGVFASLARGKVPGTGHPEDVLDTL